MRCPSCSTELEPFRLEDGLEVDLCGRCNGLWFERGELARALGAPRDLMVPAPDGADAPEDAPSCPACVTVCLVETPWVRGHPHTLHWCPYCEGLWTRTATLARLRALASDRPWIDPEALARLPDGPKRLELSDPDEPLARPLSLRLALLTLPAALGFVFLCRVTVLPGFVLGLFRVMLHELGHAVAAWLCAWKAVPLPWGLTLIVQSRSWAVYLAFLTLWTLGVVVGIARRRPRLALASALAAVLQARCTFGLPEVTQEALVAFGGCAGELILSTLLVVAFYVQARPRMRWDLWRWLALAIGAYVLVDMTLFWHAAAKDFDLIPWEGAWTEDGDMTVLRRDHGWTEASITGRYVTLSRLCLASLAVAYVVGALQAFWRQRVLREKAPPTAEG